MSRLLLIIILFWSQPVSGGDFQGQSPAVDGSVTDMFNAPCQELGISKALAMAIAGVESGLKPWTLNVEGQAFRFDSKKKAMEKAKEAWEAGRSFDVGLMQINSWWLLRYDIPLKNALDPVANFYFGVWILKQELDRHGNLRLAIGAYHSPTPFRANNYANLVMAALERGPQPDKAKPKQSPKIKKKKNQVDSTPTPMMVISKSSVLVTVNGMKIADTAAQHSMKIKKVKQ